MLTRRATALILHGQYFDAQRVRIARPLHRDIGDDMAGQPPFERAQPLLKRAAQRLGLARGKGAGKEMTRADEARAGPGAECRCAGGQADRQLADQQVAQAAVRAAGARRAGDRDIMPRLPFRRIGSHARHAICS